MSSPNSDRNTLSHYFHESVIERIRRELDDADGREVLFFGWTGEDRKIHRVEVITRGNEESVGLPPGRSYLPDVIVHNHPGPDTTPSQQDIRISSQLAERGVGFIILNGDLSKLYVVVEPVERRSTVPLDARELMQFVSEKGPLSSILPSFEERESQKDMIAHICDTFNRGGIALIEAGTGIGKSIAYLLPAIRWAHDNNEKVVIATNTINLQEQLLYKDIPDLLKSMDIDISYILMKGRGNYLCLNRLHEAQSDLFSLIEEEEVDQFNAIGEWLQTAEEETLSHLPFVPKPSLWDKINSQTGTCLGGRCPYFSKCPINRVRRSAARAHLIITNHHYLLADAQLGENGSLLPPYRRVVFDEAHNLEDSATSFFTRTIRISTALKILGRIYAGQRREKGYLVYLQRRGTVSDGKILRDLMSLTSQVRSQLFEMFEQLEQYIAGRGSSEGKDRESVIEIGPDMSNDPSWSDGVLPSIDRFYRSSSQLALDLFDLRQRLDTGEDEILQRQIDGLVSGLMDMVETLDLFLGDDVQRFVRWVERRGETGIVVALIEVGEILHQLLFSRVTTCIMTSATLTVGGSFEFLRSRLSLEETDLNVSLPSPFDYDRQMLVLVPGDVRQPGHPNYGEDISAKILALLEKSGGRAFVLFTSYRMLEFVHDAIGARLRESGFPVFKQGSDSRSSLLDRFKTEHSSVLFGTVSFWEGVDAPGRTLECVIITKLPFRVPTEPIIKARSERISARGGTPFLEYQMPLAVIKLRQGIGRLIRNSSDRGVVVILDPRILTKSYGSVFLDSLPSSNVFRGSFDDVLERTEAFFGINS
jgi:ATP-dependent DNA helicase DinG